jgi:uncharacterized membrane protein YhaH (DUF805 family)
MFDLKLVFNRAFQFSGRATRSEFWTGYLAIFVVGVPFFFLDKVLNFVVGNMFYDFWIGYKAATVINALGQGISVEVFERIYMTLMPGLVAVLYSVFAWLFVAASSTRRLRDAGWFEHLFWFVALLNLGSAGISFVGSNRMANYSSGYDITASNFQLAMTFTILGFVASMLSLAASVIWLVGVSMRSKPSLS